MVNLTYKFLHESLPYAQLASDSEMQITIKGGIIQQGVYQKNFTSVAVLLPPHFEAETQKQWYYRSTGNY